MKKLFSSLAFVAKALFLVVLLLFGWVFINVTNLVKGKKAAEKDSTGKIFGPDTANADAPSCGVSCYIIGCPHVAVFDGKEFRVENDFLLGKPKSFFTDYSAIRAFYEGGRIGPDLLKFHVNPKERDGKPVLQIQEIEEEETFIDWLKLIRVVHPKDSEVLVDSSFTTFYVLSREWLKNNITLPASVFLNRKTKEFTEEYKQAGVFQENSNKERKLLFKRDDSLDITFRGLDKNKETFLVIRSLFRDWMMGEEAASSRALSVFSFLRSPLAARAAMLFAGAAYLLFGHKMAGSAMAFAPFIVGSGTECKSIIFYYRESSGVYRQIIIHEPRDWKEGTESIVLPKESIQEDGTLTVRADFTKRHMLNFVGVLQGAKETAYKKEELSLIAASHSRDGDVSGALSSGNGEYAHLIPGDTVDITFDNPKIKREEHEDETYLMQSSGFYTALRKDYKKIAGNWQDKLSQEAKEHYRELVSVRSYK